jgi:diguanylate cyclase (GGDEF)-like protein/PAS domain S-box-containing protein
MHSRYDAILTALSAGVVIHAADTTILDANERARTLLGLQDLEGRLATDPGWVFLEADHSPMALARFPVMQVISSGEPLFDLTMVVVPPEGLEKWVEVNAVPVFDATGQLEQIVVTFIDVTARKLAETRLAEQAERFELVLASSRQGLWDWNMDTGEAVIDERWAEIVGYRLEELEPISVLTWRSLCHPDDLAVSDASIAEHAEGLTPHYDIEVRMRHRDGHWVWTHDRGRIVEWARDGHPVRMTGTQEDVSAAHVAAAELAAAEEESRLALDRSRVATCLVSNDGRLVRVNPAICDLLGRSEAELLGMSFLDVTYPDDRAVGIDLVSDLLAGRRPSLRLTKRYITGNGRVIWGDVTVSSVLDQDGTVRHRIAQILDVTAEHDLHASLMEAERIAHLGGWRLDVATGKVVWSLELYAMFGLDPAGPVPDYPDQERLFTPESWLRLSAAIAQTEETGVPYVLELEMLRPDGSSGWLEARGEAVRDANGDIVELHGVTLDITDRKATSDALKVLALRDPLTGLANRAELLDEMTRAIHAGRRSGRSTAVLLMDLDRFKAINDAFGHAAGDELLMAAAERLGSLVRADDLVARLGGDEFVVVMRDVQNDGEAVRAGDRLVEGFRAPFTLGGRELFSTASVGVAITTEVLAAGDLLAEADTAMYAAKDAGRDRASLFNEDRRAAVAPRLLVEGDLRHALERGQFAVWYQPEVDLASGTVAAVEALLRWHHPDGSLWTADRFITVAEETGLILDIGDWVLSQACTQAAFWAAARPDCRPTVRVNVSALQLSEAGLLAALDDALATSGLDPALLCVEITESALLLPNSATAANVAGIHSRGVSLAIDDFGTGYASLTYLNLYPIDVIKIDRSFITDTTAAGHDHRLVAGIVALAKLLDIGVIAEGVEQSEQADHLRELGCPSAQGWLFSKPLPAEDVTPLFDHVFPHPDIGTPDQPGTVISLPG